MSYFVRIKLSYGLATAKVAAGHPLGRGLLNFVIFLLFSGTNAPPIDVVDGTVKSARPGIFITKLSLCCSNFVPAGHNGIAS